VQVACTHGTVSQPEAGQLSCVAPFAFCFRKTIKMFREIDQEQQPKNKNQNGAGKVTATTAKC